MVKDPSAGPQVLATAPLGLLLADGVAFDAVELDPDVLVTLAEVAPALDVISLADRVADCVVAVCGGKRSGGVTTDTLSSRMIAKSGLVLFTSPSTADVARDQLGTVETGSAKDARVRKYAVQLGTSGTRTFTMPSDSAKPCARGWSVHITV